ncbi:MAG: four helix bundle protein [Nitrospiraceae bacterium]|nr:four helix bundle protein [Nitrospiraceae bacterium]
MGKNTDTHGQPGTGEEGLIPKHGGYRNLKTFQLAEVIYDVTVRFCDKYIDRRSRTHDQMVQAARSGRQNIAEGSMDSATSKKIELKLTGIARGSLEELRLDYEDYLRQRGLPQWEANHPALVRFKARRCGSLDEFRAWVAEEVKRAKEDTAQHGQTPTDKTSIAGVRAVRESPCPSVFVANGALSLLNLCIYLLNRQMNAQAEAFEKNGGFTERLYRRRTQARRHEKG